MNYTLSQIAKIVGGKLYGSDLRVTRISIDSRESLLSSEHLFIALEGVGRDGHNYIQSASGSGVVAFLVKRLPLNWESLGSFIECGDTLCALQNLAAYYRSTFKAQVVAITGSNGKTTVKEWFGQLWPLKHEELFRSPRSFNSQIGVPLSILMASAEERVVVIEVGISKPAEMDILQKIVRPTIGVITNIGDAHSENFKDIESKLAEKLKLFSELPPDRIVRGDINSDSNIKSQNEWLVEQIYRKLELDPLKGVELLPLSLRLEVQQGVFDSLIINDSYSNDLLSLQAALEFACRESNKRPLHLILTDIEQSAMGNEELYGKVAELTKSYNIASFIGIGKNIYSKRKLFCELPSRFFIKTKELLTNLEPSDFAGAVVLIKGARSFRTERISTRLEERTHTTTLEVNLSKIIDNLKEYQSHCTPQTKVMAMVKASSYGLGALSVSRALLASGVDILAVAYADEGVALRRGGITSQILVLNSDPGSFRSMVENSLEPEIYSISSLRSYLKEVKRAGLHIAPIHIKIDSGMHRLGFMEQEIEELIEIIEQENLIKVSTIFTHLAAADDPSNDDFTLNQISIFDRVTKRIINRIGYRPLLSIANSAATLRLPSSHRDIIRLGIALYQGSATLRSKITQIKDIPKGESIGYNRRTVLQRDSRIATIPIGYADGLRRELGCGKLQVLVGETMCDIAGTVCMDTTMIDITDADISIKEGDSVTILGGEAKSENQIAELLDTINYEVLTSISPRIKRLYTW